MQPLDFDYMLGLVPVVLGYVPLTLGMATAAALNGMPSWNIAPSARINRQVAGLVWVPDVARFATMLPSSMLMLTSVSVTLLRSTRLLPTRLVFHNVVARSPTDGQFLLGGQLAVPGAQLACPDTRQSVIEAAAPAMQALALELKEAVRISVRDGDTAPTIHPVQCPTDCSLSVRIGHTVPLYAGGAGKLLLAHAPPEQIDRILRGKLANLTPYTITDPAVLRGVLARIIKEG